MSKRRSLALAWSLVVCALFIHNLYLFMGKHIQPDTDILALLPVEERDPVLHKAFTQMVDATEQKVIVLVGAKDWTEAVKAADSYTEIITKHADLLQISHFASNASQNEWLNLFYQHRLNLLTLAQRHALQTQTEEYWLNTALSKLYSPFSGPKLGPWQEDPFDLFNGWVQTRMQETPVRPRDGKLFVANEERQYIVIPITLQASAFSVDAGQAIIPVLKQAREAARGTGENVEVLTAGLILHAAVASERAHEEISTIGLGSMIGVILLIWLTFRSLKPILLITLSIVVGCLGALSLCMVIYDQVHLVTLVFGASLIGVAQDYGIYFLCNRANAGAQTDSWQLMKRLFPGMFLTFLTTIIGYLALALTPFPGLRQMAVFSGFGLLFAWLTVVCWFPFLLGTKAFKREPKWEWYQRSLKYWPVASLNKPTVITLLVFVAFAIFGIARLNVNDDIRLLQNPQANLIEEQKKISTLLDIPVPTQFYIVRGATPEVVLQREEILKGHLEPLIEKQTISGYQALSNWIPSAQTQQANRTLVEEKLLGSQGPLSALGVKIGGDSHWITSVRHNLLMSKSHLTIDAFLSTPVSEALRHLWLGKVNEEYAGMVLLRGVSMAGLPVLSHVADDLEGIQWVDKVGEISSVLGKYRHYMGWVVLISYGIIYALLFLRYRRDTWRVTMPTIVASIGTLAVLGVIGQNLQLFNMLGFMLILGVGVDYGIFWQENVSGNKQAVWMEIGLSSTTTLLSFGLLSLSSTPALRSFGITMLVGLTLAWVTVPCFGRKERP